MKSFKNMFAGVMLALALASPALAGSLTNFAENKLVDATLRAQAIGTPVTWHVALFTACPTDSTAGTEVSGVSYARAAVTAGLAQWAGTQAAGSTVASTGTLGTTSNNAAIPFATPGAGGWGSVACWGLMDAALGSGNLWIFSDITGGPKVINAGDTVSFGIGAATFQIDN